MTKHTQEAIQHRNHFLRLAGERRFAPIQGGSLSKTLARFGAGAGWGDGTADGFSSCTLAEEPTSLSSSFADMVVVGERDGHGSELRAFDVVLAGLRLVWALP